MNNIRGYIWFIAATLFAVGVVVLAMAGMVTDPAHMIPELGGDAIKNTFTYLWHSLHGSGAWFTGMNYPYGEHIVYTDGQPIISVPLSRIDGLTVGDALTVLWMAIGLSYVISILFLYRILLHFRVSPLWAIIFSGLIGIFTPQLFRLQGHYALSYACIIPMLFWWNIRYFESGHRKYCLYFFLLGCVASFLHPYYAGMMLVWVVFYSLSYFLLKQERLVQKFMHIAGLFIAVVLVVAVVALTMKFTDPVTDRPQTPFNTLYETCTRIKQVITSVHSPVWQALKGSDWYYIVNDGGEGYVYLGLVIMFTVALAFATAIKKSVGQRKLVIPGADAGFSAVWLLMSFLVLLFSMGIPFKWHMEGLMQHMSLFKQFRSLGRFSWIFYYMIAIYTVVVLYHWCISNSLWRSKVVGYAILMLAVGIWSFEASGYVRHTRRLAQLGRYNYSMFFSENEPGWSDFLKQHGHAGSDFQAVIIIPFFHIGTEKLWVGNSDWEMTLSGKAAMQLGLPIVDVMMSRSSWGQAMKQVKIEGGPVADKPLLRDIASDKPFLLLHFEEDTLDPDQRFLLQAADYLGNYSQCNVYACYPNRIGESRTHFMDSVAAIASGIRKDTLIGNGSYYIDHLDAGVKVPHLFGAGGSKVIDKDSSIIADIPVMTSPGDSQLYEFSCWFLLGDEDYRSPYVSLQLQDAQGRIVHRYDALTRKSADNYGMWFRSSRYFYVQGNVKMVRCVLMNLAGPAYKAMDELLLRPAAALVIARSADGKVMVNNHIFEPNNR